MGRARRHADRLLLFITGALLVSGLFIFSSAALGFLARSDVSISSIVFNHLILGVGLGVLVLMATGTIHYRKWRIYAPYLFAAAIGLTLLVFIPGIGISAGGAARWVELGFVSFQPSEALKIATVLFLAWYLARYRRQIAQLQYGLGGILAVLAIPIGILLLQPDTGTIGVIVAAALAMYIAAGARWRDIAILLILGVMLLGALAIARPYVLERVTTFINPFSDQQNAGYQIKQSLIAIGSGGVTGRGFGQSVQKFSYLPEPISDSIFAVAAEEFGIIGSYIIIGLFAGFATRGLWIAARAPDYFGGILAVGIVVMIVGQAFINVAAMLGIIPLTGIPLVFMSQGGTAMLVALGSVGILLNISKHVRPKISQ